MISDGSGGGVNSAGSMAEPKDVEVTEVRTSNEAAALEAQEQKKKKLGPCSRAISNRLRQKPVRVRGPSGRRPSNVNKTS